MTGDWKAEAQALERRGDMSGANERVVGAGHEGHSEAYVELASILSQRGLNDEAQRALDAAEAVAREDDVTTHFAQPGLFVGSRHACLCRATPSRV